MNQRTMCRGFLAFTVFFLAAFADALLVLVQVGQVNPKRGTPMQAVSMAEVNVSGYGDALSSAFSYPILGLYTDNVSTPLHARAGLRQLYKFGIHSHCAYVNKTAGLCTGATFAYPFQPYTVITNDMLSNYSDYTNTILHDSTFAYSSSLGRSSRAANCLLLFGTILSITSLVIGPIWSITEHTWALLVSSSTAVLAPIPIFVGSAIWTAIIKKANDVSSWKVQPDQLPLGIEVSAGGGLVCAWIAFAFLVASAIIPTISVMPWLRTFLSRARGLDPSRELSRMIRNPAWGWVRKSTGGSPCAAQPEHSC